MITKTDHPEHAIYPRTVAIRSDYSPETMLRITMTDDGDVVFKIRGPGEMRIATSGGQFHGLQLAQICEAAKALITAIEGAPNEHNGETMEETTGIELGGFVKERSTGKYRSNQQNVGKDKR